MPRHLTNASKSPGAKPSTPKFKKTAIGVGNSSTNPDRKMKAAKVNGGEARSKATINMLNMYKSKSHIRNKAGKVVGGQFVMATRAGGKEIDSSTGRIAPDRRWFGNTRVVGAEELDKFREEMRVKAADPYSVILRRKKLPMGLLVESAKATADGGRTHLLEVETFAEAFDGQRQRKRPKLASASLEALAQRASAKEESYDELKDRDAVREAETIVPGRLHDLFLKGQSKRIWAELYKVIDCSDVVLHVLDARNIPGTRCVHLEHYLKRHAAHKHMVFIVNKCDLVPTWVTKKWVTLLSQTTPTLAFHATNGTPFGKGALISLLRQYSKLHSDKKAISVGIVGYPNVGKSSVINTLTGSKSVKVAPVPGETKIWQYVSLMKRISLVDCPGIVYDTGDSETDTVLKGVVRAERLPDPTDFIPALLARSKPEHLIRTYGIAGWRDAEDFMTQLARRNGRLRPGGEPDFQTIAVQLINDWQRGKLPFFVPPPGGEGGEGDDATAGAAVAGPGEGVDGGAFESAMAEAARATGPGGAEDGEQRSGTDEDDDEAEEEVVEGEKDDEDEEDDAYDLPENPPEAPAFERRDKPLSKRHERLKAKFLKLEAAGLEWDDL